MSLAASRPHLALTLYTREECPLCQALRAALEAWNAGRHVLDIDFVDVDDDPTLAARYGDRVPVLVAADEELCAGHFDPSALAALTARG
ncbi:MAG: glutaredoxin family protein [Gammaproteobacteria bacterium]